MPITFENCLITPAMAAEMLTHANQNNRNITRKRVLEYADTMKNGGWQDNGECIQFYEDGTLANGHHRLNAIILANVPVRMSILRGLPNNTTIFDRGRNRNTRDTLAHAGVVLPTKAVSAVKLLYSLSFGMRNPGDDKMITYCERYCHELKEATKISICGKGNSRIGDKAYIVLAIFVAMRNGVHPAILGQFMKCVNSGFVESERETSAIVLRNYLLSHKKKGTTTPSETLSIALRAIDDFRYGVPKRTYRKIEDTGMLKNVIAEDKRTFGENWSNTNGQV